MWQQRLKLNDWRINWAMARRTDLKPNTVGQIHWDKPGKIAAILVLDSSDYRMPFSAMLDDMELTIIHELVHLKLTSLPHSEASRGREGAPPHSPFPSCKTTINGDASFRSARCRSAPPDRG